MHYLLKVSAEDQAGAIAIYVVSLAITLTVLFFLIKAAVKAGTKDLLRFNRLLANLKAEEMRANGKQDAVDIALQNTNAYENLLKAKDQIGQEKFDQKRKGFVA